MKKKERIKDKCESRSVYAPFHVALIAVYKALKKNQGLFVKNGQIEEIRGKQEKISPNQPLTEEQKPILRIQSAQACADKDSGLSSYIEGTVPDIDEQNILMSSGTSTKENNKPETIKFNKERLMEIAKPESIEEKYNIDIEKMVKEYRENLNSAFLPLGYYPSQLNEFTKVYKRGLEDILKVIKGGE